MPSSSYDLSSPSNLLRLHLVQLGVDLEELKQIALRSFETIIKIDLAIEGDTLPEEVGVDD